MRTILHLLVATLACGLTVARAADARDVHMIAPDIPPHFDRAGKGRIADIINAVMEKCGHAVRFSIVPFGRHWKDYADDARFDGLATAEADQSFPGFTTKAFIHLQDGATVVVGRGLQSITNPGQLAGKRIVAFPQADRILGIEALVPTFKSFNMLAERFDQLRPLFANRADAILADGLITAHFITVLRQRAAAGEEPDIDPSLQVTFRKLFAAGPQRLYFRDQSLANDFDRCAKELRGQGSLRAISIRYIDRYRGILGDQYPID